MANIIWQPQPGPQTEFCQSMADYVLYGGARGGGKTDALLAEATRYGSFPDYKGLFLRRTFPQLSEVLERTNRLYKQLGWKWEGEKRMWRSPSGAFIKFGHCQHEKDKYEYIGQEYHRIFYDQVERFTETQFFEINTTLRSTNPNIPTQIFASANPGGIGHVWVKNKWLDRCPTKNRGNKIFNESFNIEWQPKKAGPAYVDKFKETWEFHPALVFDNPMLMDNDPKYVRKLLALPYEQKEAYLWGNWDVFVGQYFQEWRYDIHVVDPIKVPYSWPVYGGCDWATTGWYFGGAATVDYDGNVFFVAEQPLLNKSMKYKAKMADRLIEKYPQMKAWVVPHDMFKQRDDREADYTETILDRFNSYISYEVPFVKAQHHRVPRWDLMKDGFSWGEGDSPWLYVTSDCPKLIETIPAQIHSETNPEDLDTDAWDHGVDFMGMVLSHIKEKKKSRREAFEDAYTPKRKKKQISKLRWLTL